jgi:hypothetical protein
LLPYRLHAVGYAARQISSQEQLELLLLNPPVPKALDASPEYWITAKNKAVIECEGCGALCKMDKVGWARFWCAVHTDVVGHACDAILFVMPRSL